MRAGFSSYFDELRRRGHDPERYLDEIAAEQEMLRAKGVMLDSDPNNAAPGSSGAGSSGKSKPASKGGSGDKEGDDNGDDGDEEDDN